MWRRNELNDSHEKLDRGDELISRAFGKLNVKLTRLKPGAFALVGTLYLRNEDGWKPCQTFCTGNAEFLDTMRLVERHQKLVANMPKEAADEELKEK